MEVQADSTRQLGDPKMYTFYARAAGRITLATFLVSMMIFAFCESFPSKLSNLVYAVQNLSNTAQVFGLSGGPRRAS